jgi:2-polyprenyl-3-methyl-5-hydroxy-6-metoxy-1,4-benzoquinol methylase
MAAGLANDKEIRTVVRTKCPLCGSGGSLIYTEQKDRLFSAGGSWNLKACSDSKCGLMWLDPMPVLEDIGKAYANYYTHVAQEGSKRAGLLKQAYILMRREYLAAKYNYPIGSPSIFIKCLGKALYLFPVHCNEVDSEARHLQAIPQGRLLDVGCGSGEWLTFMRELGWLVEGVDFDDDAVKVARKDGLEVKCGSLEHQGFPNDNFDVVTLSHVIEHVPDPVETLAECVRILKPGGKLVLFTPNSASLSHNLFKQDWRGLEPPRHLHIFSEPSLRQALESVGIKEVIFHPQIAKSVFCESVLLRQGRIGPFTASDRSRQLQIFARFFNFIEWCCLKWNPSVADCMAAVAVKQ